MKKYLIILSFLVFSHTLSLGKNVMTWIPVYGINSCKTLMNDPQKSVWLKNSLTHVGLQFWVPGDNGQVVFLTDYKFTYKASTIAGDVNDFVTWGNANQVKIMLCLFNIREDDFDWTYAKNVIDNYPNETVTNVMSIVNTYGLDGVDIDFEGVGDFSSDKSAFVSFLDTLGKALHASGKELSVDMFSTPCYNSPNPTWESAMAPHIDFMNIMGYNNTYKDENTIFLSCPQAPAESGSYPFRYSYIENFLTVKQGVVSSKLNYGIPAWEDSWGGQCAHGNILDILDVSTGGGIAIWDLTLGGGGFWQDPVTWELIAMFKNDSTSSQIRNNSLVCGSVTPLEGKKEIKSPIFYDSYYQFVNLSGMSGYLYLYSSTGVLEKSWTVMGGENISLETIRTGFYILSFKNESLIFNQGISVIK